MIPGYLHGQVMLGGTPVEGAILTTNGGGYTVSRPNNGAYSMLHSPGTFNLTIWLNYPTTPYETREVAIPEAGVVTENFFY